RAAAVPEVVEAGRTGLLVSPRDPEALAGAMETLLTNVRLRAELGAAGRRRVEDFDLERVAARLLDVLPPAEEASPLARRRARRGGSRSRPATPTGWGNGRRPRSGAWSGDSPCRTDRTP